MQINVLHIQSLCSFSVHKSNLKKKDRQHYSILFCSKQILFCSYESNVH